MSVIDRPCAVRFTGYDSGGAVCDVTDSGEDHGGAPASASSDVPVKQLHVVASAANLRKRAVAKRDV